MGTYPRPVSHQVLMLRYSCSSKRLKVTLLLNKEIPNRSIHPNLYFWFIYMKQFAHRSLKAWVTSDDNSNDDDRLIEEYIQYESHGGEKDKSDHQKH